ncbi:MAG: chondroitinase-B domain-containing protein, partial [Myxococcota bacterium]
SAGCDTGIEIRVHTPLSIPAEADVMVVTATVSGNQANDIRFDLTDASIRFMIAFDSSRPAQLPISIRLDRQGLVTGRADVVLEELVAESCLVIEVPRTTSFNPGRVFRCGEMIPEFIPPNIAGRVALSGEPTPGRTLTAEISDDNGFDLSAVVFQWALDGDAISGAVTQSYTLDETAIGRQITVRAEYIDDDGYSESVTSATVGPIVQSTPNTEGLVSIVGSSIVGETLTASVEDINGSGNELGYQWRADGANIEGATSSTYTVRPQDRLSAISVVAFYIDGDGYFESPQSAATDIVYDGIATGEQSLRALVAIATRGAVIGLANPTGDDDYQDMAEIEFMADDLIVQRTAASSAVIRGATCIVFSGDNTVVDGLVFDDLDLLVGGTCDANGDSSIYLRGNGIVIKNSKFRGEAEPRTVPRLEPYTYISIRGISNTIERNLFEGKDMDLEGAAITMFAGLSDDDRSHVIQYNLFKNFFGKSGDPTQRISTAYVLQLGRATGMAAAGEGFITVQYNRFDAIEAERRVFRVQSSSNLIQDNTIINSLGMISLDDGFGTTVRRNIIVAVGEDVDEGGISFAPLRHTIVDNYINNLGTVSSRRAGLVVSHEALSGAGNR